MTQPVCPATWDAAFDTFRKYWNSCEENNIPPEFGRVFAIFSEALRGSRSEGPQMLCADWEKRLCSEYDEPMTHKDVARFVRSMSSAPSATPNTPVDPESEAANPVWDLVIAKCHSAYPERQGMHWGESPLELITEIIDDRDAFRLQVKELLEKGL